ncbi:hypothetical protein WR25_02393 [Diploscapter pachys]|uniref:DUF19 domain-containing protein n=1 Tax=Diploscapter pachys TaxID=2018661 RepID=A0A2A2LLU4_9BILA|nr:hypothetical protein WR25_02393 [Diploscapter pachys]
MTDSVIITVLHGSRKDIYVRQCTCLEMTNCYEEAKLQAYDCMQPCWDKVPPVTNQSGQLMTCFNEKKAFIDEIISCFEANVKGCQPTITSQPMLVTDYDYTEMIRLVEQAAKHQVAKFISAITSEQVKRVVNSATELGHCVKECFIEKNRNEFCFDKLGCEPKIDDAHANAAVRRCAKQVKWKMEAQGLCNCQQGRNQRNRSLLRNAEFDGPIESDKNDEE